MAWEPLYTEGKRDKARRYRNTDTGEIRSRRFVEDLTARQRESRELKREGKVPGGKLVPSRRDKTYAHGTHHWVRFGPYPSLHDALYEPRIGDFEPVVLGAQGMMLATARSGTPNAMGWLALSSLSEYASLRSQQSLTRIFERRKANFQSVRGYFVWVRRD